MYVEVEYKNEHGVFFLKINLKTEEIWVDTKALPDTALLCASHDAQMAKVFKCGDDEEYERTFLNMEWLINEWGAKGEILEKLIQVRDYNKKQIPMLREKYAYYQEQCNQ